MDIGKTAWVDSVNILWRAWPGDDSAPYYNDTPVTYTLDSGLIDVIGNLDPDVFKNKNMGNALMKKINSVLEMIDQGLYQDTSDKLKNDVLKKTDGCAKIMCTR